MASIPSKLTQGQQWKESTIRAINQIIDYLKSQRIVGDNQTVSVNHTVNGITISAKPQAPAKPPVKSGGTVPVVGSAVLCKTYSQDFGGNYLTYQGLVYAKGINNGSDGTYEIIIPQMYWGAKIPHNTYILAHPYETFITGGSEGNI